MANLKAFAAHDTRCGIFHPPFFFLHAGMMLRHWEDLVNDPKTIIGRHPNEYQLLEIGEYDDSKGVLTPATAKMVATGSEYLKKPGVDPKQASFPS